MEIKLIYNDYHGQDYQRVSARKKGLVKDSIYILEHIEVGGWNSDVYLKEYPNVPFNSALFNPTEECEEAFDKAFNEGCYHFQQQYL